MSFMMHVGLEKYTPKTVQSMPIAIIVKTMAMREQSMKRAPRFVIAATRLMKANAHAIGCRMRPRERLCMCTAVAVLFTDLTPSRRWTIRNMSYPTLLPEH